MHATVWTAKADYTLKTVHVKNLNIGNNALHTDIKFCLYSHKTQGRIVGHLHCSALGSSTWDGGKTNANISQPTSTHVLQEGKEQEMDWHLSVSSVFLFESLFFFHSHSLHAPK